MIPARPHACERARSWLSLRLDGQLSEVESVLLAAHLSRCESCAALGRGFEHATRAIRETPLETPGALAVEAPAPPVPSVRARGSLRRFQAAAAASVAAVVVVGAGSVFAALQLTAERAQPKLERVSAAADGAPDLDLLDRARVLRKEYPVLPHGVWPA